jgi:hypothetical protein
MANLTITAANVLAGGTATLETGTAGVAITQGQPVYKEAATGLFKLSDANLAGAKDFYGVALNAASTGQPVTVAKLGQVTIGATLVKGTTYAVANIAGAICPQADLTTGDDVIIIGAALSTTVLDIKPHVLGVTL